MTFFYRAVFFDFDETLRLRLPGPTDGLIEFLQQEGYFIEEGKVRALKRWVHQYWADDDRVNREMARYGKEGFRLHYSGLLIEAALSKTATSELPKRVHDWFYQVYSPEIQLAPGSRQMLQKLREAGFVLGLISNRRDPLADAVEELGLTNYFDLMLAAGEVGHWKPDPAIFYAALERCGTLRAQECLYVGDNYHADGVGAAKAGLTPVLFDPDRLYEATSFRRVSSFEELTAVLLPL